MEGIGKSIVSFLLESTQHVDETPVGLHSPSPSGFGVVGSVPLKNCEGEFEFSC